MRRQTIAAGLAAVAVLGVLSGRALALSMSSSGSTSAGHTFTLTGSVAGLLPGRPAPLQLTVANPDSQPIRLTSATATARSASSSCPASLLTITAFAGTPQTVVAAHGQAVVNLTVTLSSKAPDACAKVSFPLTYAGQADQWQ